MSPACFAHLAALLQPVAPLALLLEGGYNLDVTARSVAACMRVLLGERPPPLPSASAVPSASGLATIREVTAEQVHLFPVPQCFRSIDRYILDPGVVWLWAGHYPARLECRVGYTLDPGVGRQRCTIIREVTAGRCAPYLYPCTKGILCPIVVYAAASGLATIQVVVAEQLHMCATHYVVSDSYYPDSSMPRPGHQSQCHRREGAPVPWLLRVHLAGREIQLCAVRGL